jgi:hypothetical protein
MKCNSIPSSAENKNKFIRTSVYPIRLQFICTSVYPICLQVICNSMYPICLQFICTKVYPICLQFICTSIYPICLQFIYTSVYPICLQFICTSVIPYVFISVIAFYLVDHFLIISIYFVHLYSFQCFIRCTFRHIMYMIVLHCFIVSLAYI